MKLVAYLRVSTSQQGRSGLGIEAQRTAVARYAHANSLEVAAEHVEVESGRRSDRPQLQKALVICRLHRADLIVAKVDRLTRSVAFFSALLESGVGVRFCDLPSLEGPTGRFMLTQMAAVAELEAGMISARTKAALAAAKARGVRLGGHHPQSLTNEGRASGRISQSRKAFDHSKLVKPLVEVVCDRSCARASAHSWVSAV